MKIGTKTLLVGYHQFLIHPLLVAAAWWKLYGFPWDPRLWVAFLIHDWGYVGKRNMDGVEGKQHPFWGAEVMHELFDSVVYEPGAWFPTADAKWHNFTLYHSRTLANLYFAPLSKLGYADKLAFLYYPKWLLKILYALSGEGAEYLINNGITDWDEWYKVAADSNIKTLKGAHNDR